MIKLINADVLKADLNGLPPINLVVTSPPYNCDIKYENYKDALTYEQYLQWCKLWLKKMYDAMAEDGRICINIPISVTFDHLKIKGEEVVNYPISADYIRIVQEVGFKFYRVIIWEKMGSNKTCWGSWRSARAPFVIDPNECILVFYKGTWKRKEKGESTISAKEFMLYIKNLWSMAAQKKSNHPAAFPPELPKRCIQLFSYKGDTVMDCFMGSGTTGEVSVQWERSFAGIEMSQSYFDEATTRIEGAYAQIQVSKQVMPKVPADNTDKEAW
jgi:site-specific DNA-methyltransferase (adenine-specific)